MKPRLLSFLSLLIAFSSPTLAENQDIPLASESDLSHAIYETVTELQHIGSAPICFPNPLSSAQLHILSTNNGGIRFFTGGDANPALVEVTIQETELPVYLVLAAYNSVIWRIKPEPEARIAGVALTGYHLQYVLDLPDGTPLGSRAVIKRGLRQQLDCEYGDALSEEAKAILNRRTFTNIDSQIQADRVRQLLVSLGVVEFGGHQYVGGDGTPLEFVVTD